MALELLSLLCTFENSTKCSKVSFDSDSFSEWLKGLLTFKVVLWKDQNEMRKKTRKKSISVLSLSFQNCIIQNTITITRS